MPELDECDCLEFGKTPCEGRVILREPLARSGNRFPRCELHWEIRLERESEYRFLNPEGLTDDPDWIDQIRWIGVLEDAID